MVVVSYEDFFMGKYITSHLRLEDKKKICHASMFQTLS